MYSIQQCNMYFSKSQCIYNDYYTLKLNTSCIMTKTNIIYVRVKSTESIVRANDEQIKFLIDYMGRHKDFAAGRFIGVQGKIKLRSQWESLTNSLNEIGPTKSSEKWQNVIYT